MDRDEHVLIAGGGVAALEAMLALKALAGDLLSVGLVAPEPQFWYRPLAVAEPFGLAAVRHFDLAVLANEAGALFVPDELVSVDAARRLAYMRSRRRAQSSTAGSSRGRCSPATRRGARCSARRSARTRR